MLSYKELYHKLTNKEDIESFRLEIVKDGLEIGICKSAIKHKVNRKTVSKWVNRYKKGEDLKDNDKSPLHCPHRISRECEKKIVDYAMELKANRNRIVGKYIRDYLCICYSVKAVINVLKRNGFFEKKEKKQSKNQRSFYEYKQSKYEVFEKIQVDVKYLTDIKEFESDRLKYRLGNYIYSARCIKSGFYYVSEAMECNLENSMRFMEELFSHLKKNGIEIRGLKIQTDNGSEFGLGNRKQSSESEFVKLIESYGAKHNAIPLGAKTWQSDVETAHRLIEDEHFATNVFYSKKDYRQQSKSYLQWFNKARINKHKEGRSPWQIIKQSSLKIKEQICFYQYHLLDDLHFQC